MRIAIVLGTRPEIIKLSPVIRACQRRQTPFFLLHTGQHYSYEMDRVFFEQLELPEPDFNLDVGSGPHGEQTDKMLAGIERVLREQRPDAILVQGDTNSVVAGALAASKLGIRVGHLEAGLRSHDRSMPEEINRIVADHISDYLFPPTEVSAKELAKEGIPPGRVFITGNTIVDAVMENRGLANARSRVLERLGLQPRQFMLLTAHRQENVDIAERFRGIVEGSTAAAAALGLPIVYPIHPRSRKMLERFEIAARDLRIIDPVDFLDFLRLEGQARIILTDSGGVQEEACILGVPCVTLRDNTERPETVSVGANELAGADARTISRLAMSQANRSPDWRQPYGDGRAAERILDILQRALSS